MIGHEQRIQVFVGAIQCLVATAPNDLDDVLALAQIALRYDDVFFSQHRLHPLAVHADDLLQLFRRALEVQLQVFVAIPREAHNLHECHGFLLAFRNGERQRVMNVTYMCGTLGSQRPRNTFLNGCGMHGGASQPRQRDSQSNENTNCSLFHVANLRKIERRTKECSLFFFFSELFCIFAVHTKNPH